MGCISGQWATVSHWVLSNPYHYVLSLYNWCIAALGVSRNEMNAFYFIVSSPSFPILA